MTNKDKLNRIKEIEAQQISLIDALKVLDNSIRVLDPDSNEYLIARGIYDEHSAEMKLLISEKVPLFLSLGFTPSDGMIDESLRETSLWKEIDSEKTRVEDLERRQSVCTGCPEFVTISGQCRLLGEFVSDYAALEDSSCPIGNW